MTGKNKIEILLQELQTTKAQPEWLAVGTRLVIFRIITMLTPLIY
jgi:hypothetical protein